MPLRKPANRTVVVVLALVLGTCWLYWPVRQHDFVWFDDPDYVIENAFVKLGVTWRSVSWAFTHSFSSNWHPLTWIFHMLDWQWFGPQAGGHHLVSVAFHAVNAALLFGFLRRATGAFWRPAVVAALFAWHPAHVESVAWISERKDVLSTFFGLLSLWAYVNYARGAEYQASAVPAASIRNPQPATRWYAAALATFALGLMSKPMLVTWPCVMLLLDFWPLQRFAAAPDGRAWRKIVVEKIPFFALTVASCVVTVLAQDKWHALANAEQIPLEHRLVNAVISYAGYLAKLLWPAKLCAFYPFVTDSQWERALYGGFLLAGISAAVLWQLRARPHLATGWFWYLGTLVPVIGVMQVGGQAMADRYTYVPSIGFFVAVIWLVAEGLAKLKAQRVAGIALATAAIVACLGLTARQVPTWKNTRTLFEHARAVTTKNSIALNTLGELLRREGKHELAIQYFREAVAAGPSYPNAWCGLGMALYAQGNKDEAIACHEHALKLNPDDPQALDNLGLLLLWEKRPAEAEKVLRHAIEVRPGFAEAHGRLALALAVQGRSDEALPHFQAAVNFKPESAPLRADFAAALAKGRRIEEAIQEYQTAVRLQPGRLETRLAFGTLLLDSGQPAEAVAELRAALALSPTNVPALDGLGYALAQQGAGEAAVAVLQQATSLAPTNAIVWLHLALAEQRQGRLPEAVAAYETALTNAPTLVAALNNLAWLRATSSRDDLRDGKAAVALAERACQLTAEKEPMFLGTLAAAYAEAGRFAEAQAATEKARDLAKQLGLEEIARRNAELLELYRAGRPYRE